MNAGRHNAKILKNDVRAAGTGTEFIYLLLEINGEKIASQIWMSKKSINMAKAQLRACGFDTASESLLSLKENPEHLAGKVVSVDLEEEEFRGEVRLKARIVTSNVTKKRISQIDQLLKGDEKEEHSELLEKTFRKTATDVIKTIEGLQEATKPTQGTPEDDDIPF